MVIDSFTIILVLFTALLFVWVGYFLGMYFPAMGKSKLLKDKGEGRKFNLEPVKKFFKKITDYLLEREDEKESEEKFTEAGDGVVEETIEEESGEKEAAQPPPAEWVRGLSKPRKGTHLWHDRDTKKLMAEIDGDVIDLSGELSPVQHSRLSIVLVDLQEKVGVSAVLKAALSEKVDEVAAEKDKERATPKPEPEPVQPINPIKSLLNYVRADVPKLEEAKASVPEQINEILQKNIKGTSMEKRGVSVSEWPDRGVVFIVGVDLYDEIHLIPDTDVRNAIRTAVKQWEEKQAEEEKK